MGRDGRARGTDRRPRCCVVRRTFGAIRLAGMGVGNSRPLDDRLRLSHPALVLALTWVRLPQWVKMRNTHLEQMFSALHPKADSSQTSRHDRFVPIPDSCTAANQLKYIISTGEQRWWHGEAGSLAVNPLAIGQIRARRGLRPTRLACYHKPLRHQRPRQP